MKSNRKIRLVALLWLILGSISAALPSATLAADGNIVPRSLVTLYNSKTQHLPYSAPHLYLEMPANYLGYRMIYLDLNEPLPELPDSVHGIVLWMDEGQKMPDPAQYLNWLERAMDQGKKLLIIGEMGIPESYENTAEGFAHINRILGKLGLVDQGRWVNLTYDAQITYSDHRMVEFERDYGNPLPSYALIQAIPGQATSHLQVSNSLHAEGGPADLVTTNPAGGYVASGYMLYRLIRKDEESDEDVIKFQQWFVNPFAFLRQTLGDEALPKPDVTTLNGRRIFYSHMDGDGWNNLTEVEKFYNKQISSAEMIYRKVFSYFKDMPFSVGIIVGEILPECYGVPESELWARKILQLPNAEPASHTFSHPLYWNFYKSRAPEEEIKLLKYFPPRPTYNIRLLDTLLHEQNELWKAYGIDFDKMTTNTPYKETDIADWLEQDSVEPNIMRRYAGKPRSYPCSPFDIKKEIVDAAEYINSLAPEGKKVKLVQWSGDTKPFEEAIRIAREHGLYNINGGDSRFDDEYPSYASVAPIGIRVGNEWQIYSSNSNENTYTKLWTDRFFGFRYLRTTVNNTETPWRVAPFNIYFHTYSGEREASLIALLENLLFARTKEIIPIFTSQYSAIANNFYTTEFETLAENKWKVLNRGFLQTIRFDNGTLKSVDFNNSKGVIGQRHFQGSLYVALHPKVEQPVISIKNHYNPGYYPQEKRPYLIESRWQIIDLQNVKESLIIDAQGFGTGNMRWMMPLPGSYEIKVSNGGATLDERTIETEDNGLLSLVMNEEIDAAASPVRITITRR